MNVNLKPAYRFWCQNEEGKWINNVNPNGVWKASKVELSLPTSVWRDHTTKDVSATVMKDDDSADIEDFLSKRVEYKATTKSSGKTMINNWYVGGLVYLKRFMRKTKKVYHPFSGITLMEEEDAMFRIGLYKKNNYNSFIDLYDIGKNSRYLLSPAEFDDMTFKEKVK